MSKRYLDKILKETKDKFNGNFEFTNKNMCFPLQKRWDYAYGSKEEGLKVKLGFFYEILTQGIYGGNIKELQKNEDLSGQDLILTEPDVSSKKYLRESKGIRRIGDLKLSDMQIAKYFLLEMQEKGDRRIRFDVFRHDIKKLQSTYKTLPLEKLISDLTNSTLFSMSLPFSVIYEIYNAESDLTSRYDWAGRSTGIRINSSGINKLFFSLEETLESFGVRTDNLIIQRKKSPYGLKVNGMKVKPFPILVVKDKTYPSWKKSIIERFHSKDRINPEFYDALDKLNNIQKEPLEELPINEGLFEDILKIIPDEDMPF